MRVRGRMPASQVRMGLGCGLNSEHSVLTLQQWMRDAVDADDASDKELR